MVALRATDGLVSVRQGALPGQWHVVLGGIEVMWLPAVTPPMPPLPAMEPIPAEVPAAISESPETMTHTHGASKNYEVGAPVIFQTSGRMGHSPERKGTFVRLYDTPKGLYVLVKGDDGQERRVRPALVRQAG